jgi:Protein of unknown function (DUF3551)
MRLLLFMLGISVVLVGVGTHAEAQNYPWCALYRDGVWNCGFTTFQQCEATRSGNGGFCIQNNTYQTLPEFHPPARVQRRYSH